MTDNVIDTRCYNCGKYVFEHQNLIFCDICETWIHLKCSGLIKKRFIEWSESDESFFCGACITGTFPFSNLKDPQFTKEIDTPVNKKAISKLTNILAVYDKSCTVCRKSIRKPISSVPCNQCKHLIHKKCSNLSAFNSDDIETHLREWECSRCKENTLSSFPFYSIEDNYELLNLSFNSTYSCKSNSTATSLADYSHVKQLETCKLTLKEHDHLYKSDIDVNLNSFSNFSYYDNHEFHKLLNSPPLDKNKMSSILHTNISSISKNLENIEILLENLDHKFDIIGLSETWHDRNNDDRIKQLNITGFHNYVGQMGTSLKGGCGFFVADNLTFSIRSDFNKTYQDPSCEFEAFWIEVENKTKANSIFGVVYNHPRRNISAFLDYLQTVFTQINKENKLAYVGILTLTFLNLILRQTLILF